MTTSYDLLIAGAGPAGATCASFAARAGLNVLMVDKADFPRDKVCGDAISGKSVGVLRRMGLMDRIKQVDALPTWGVTFGAPSGDQVSIPFARDRHLEDPLGFVCTRSVFDQVLFDDARAAGASFRKGAIERLIRKGNNVAGLRVSGEDILAPLVVGADGAYSSVARDLGMEQMDDRHYCAAVRAYYEGVTGFSDDNFIEVHFVDEVIPGYFWVFPLPNGLANVGVGMLSRSIKQRNVRLKELLDVCVAHPRFRDRFAGATRVSTVKGWGLPLGSRPRPMAGNGWMLAGDAASLIDPFSGEGIGNAMTSGELAARWAVRARESNDFSSSFLNGYGQEVLHTLRDELRLSYAMQRLIGWKRLLNLVVRKASRSPELAAAISCMFEDQNDRKNLVSPWFYLKLLAR